MPKIVDKDERLRTISDAAMNEFRKRGFHKTRMIDIAEAVGVGKGTLYEYFKNKTDIMGFAFDSYFKVFSNGIIEVMQLEDDPARKLLAIIDFAFRHIETWETHCIVYVDYFSSERNDTDSPFSLSCIYQQITELLTQIIREAQASQKLDERFDAGALSALLVSIYDGLVLHRLFDSGSVDRKKVRETAIRLIKNGMINPGR